MKITVRSPETASLSAIDEAIQQNMPIFRSPHVGNVNNNELNIMVGIANRGASVQVELVDTIRGDDRYSSPQRAKIGNQVLSLVSRSAAKSRVVGACEITIPAIGQGTPGLQAIEVMKANGIKVRDDQPVTLKTVHTDSLEQAMPDSVMITPSTKYFKEVGEEAYELALKQTTRQITRTLRFVDAEGKIRELPDLPDALSIYGMGDIPEQGILPPLETMMALEMIRAVQQSKGADVQITHIAGPDMIRYTKQEEIMTPTRKIAAAVLTELGLGQASIDYIVPCMSTILSTPGFRTFAPDIESQYDIIITNEANGQ